MQHLTKGSSSSLQFCHFVYHNAVPVYQIPHTKNSSLAEMKCFNNFH